MQLGAFIGATDEAAEGDWRWLTSGAQMTFQIWRTNEPNNDPSNVDGREDCASMVADGWVDVPCNRANDVNLAICEFDYVPSLIGT